MKLREEMLRGKESFDGCAGLEDVTSYEEWLDFELRLRRKYKQGYTPSKVFLAIRKEDNCVVGIIDFRYPLNDFLLRVGGNIGYSVRPSERRKGYASEMLKLVLPICRKLGASKVLLTCDKTNTVSEKVILRNGGILENELHYMGYCIKRYWIHLG